MQSRVYHARDGMQKVDEPQSNPQGAPAVPAHRLVVGRHYPELDGIRGIAILLVLVFHSRIATPENLPQTIYTMIASTGWVGVDLFFVLSGFLITGILLDTCGRRHYFSNFYIRRTLRIFPLYYAVIAVLPVIAAFTSLKALEQPSLVAGVSYWLYLQNWLPLFGLEPTDALAHTWSLAIEEQFYLMWPALVIVTVRRGAVASLCIATIVLAFVIRTGLVHAGERAHFFTFSRVDTLAMGALVAVLFRRYGSLAALVPAARILALASGGVLALIVLRQRAFTPNDVMVVTFGLSALAVFFTCVLVLGLASRDNGFLRRALRSRWLCAIGVISYGVYIFHWPVVLLLRDTWSGLVQHFWAAQLGFLGLVTGASIAVAWLSYRYFESPLLRLKQRLAPAAAGT